MILDKIAIHYVGWRIKWDEWIVGRTECRRRIHSRNRETMGPHRPNRKYKFVYFCGRNAAAVASDGSVQNKNVNNANQINNSYRYQTQLNQVN